MMCVKLTLRYRTFVDVERQFCDKRHYRYFFFNLCYGFINTGIVEYHANVDNFFLIKFCYLYVMILYVSYLFIYL